MNTPQDPSEILKQRRMKSIAEARKCVAMLCTLDFINQRPSQYGKYKQLLTPHRELVKRAMAARKEIQKHRREWLKGGEEYYAIEQHLIKSLAPTMRQSEYQELDKAYQEQKKTDSIERWNKLPIIIFRSGFLP